MPPAAMRRSECVAMRSALAAAGGWGGQRHRLELESRAARSTAARRAINGSPRLQRTRRLLVARRHQARVLVQQQVDLSWARELGRPAKAAQAGVEAAGQLLHAEIDGVPLLRRGESLGRGLRAWSGGAG